MNFVSAKLRSNSGLLSQILSVVIMILSLLGVSLSVVENAKYRAAAKNKIQSAKDVTNQLDTLLNHPFSDEKLAVGPTGTQIHCSDSSDTTATCTKSPLKWTVTSKDARTRMIEVEAKTPENAKELGAQSITGYKYNDF